MFGLSQLFGAFRRLTGSVNKTADLFDQLNNELTGRLSLIEVDVIEHPALEDKSEDEPKRRTKRS